MTAKQIGNRAAFITGTGGVGAAYLPSLSVGAVTIVGKSGDVSYVGISGLNRAETNLGYYLQGVAATAQFTLTNEGIATNPDPDYQALVMWDTANEITVSNTIQLVTDKVAKLPLAFTAIKITFNAAGEVNIISR